MKKANEKFKSAQGKISSFFTKTNNIQKKIQDSGKCNKVSINEVIEINSDNDNDPKKAPIPSLKKRKSSSSENLFGPPSKKANNDFDKVHFSPLNQPSTSGNVTPPVKKIKTQSVYVKSAEKLLSPLALKEYNTPEKILERFLDKAPSTTPRKITFDEPPIKKITPKKETPKIKSVTPKKNKSSGKKITNSAEKTPRKTPKKLFDKSPTNLSEFNIEIINNFVKITPSKSNKKFVIEKEGNSTPRHIEAQKCNEMTPTRQKSPEKTTSSPSLLNVRAKMFSDVDGITNIKTEELIIKSSPPEANEQENNINLNNIDFDFNDSWDEQISTQIIEYNLDLTESHHCKVTCVTQLPTKVILNVKSTKNGEQAICNLEGFWIHTKINIGDTVHISGKKNDQTNSWILNNECGFLVYEPDLLISTTSVVNTVFCKRKSVLAEKFKGFEPTNKFMLIGILVHNLLQTALKTKSKTEQDIAKCAENLINQNNTLRRIYDCGETTKSIKDEVMTFVPKILDFLKTYVSNGTIKTKPIQNKDDWKGTIVSIEDIEENIWCPDLGIKGKVDVSVKTTSHIMPLELKTGRASVSLEHRGQVMLYIMMMNKLGYNVPSGLLLYLREGVLREIPMTIHEKRDIMILRNELTYYLTRQPEIVVEENGEKWLKPCELPEPINHSACSKCPYSVICTSYAKYTNEDISSNKRLQTIQDTSCFYLEPGHLKYFMHWISLIALETNCKRGWKDLKDIYTLTPKEREGSGKCLINLKITKVAPECNGVVEHAFEKNNCEDNINFLASGIMEGSYVVISIDNRPAVSAGFVTDISAKSITVTLDRDLNKKYSDKTFYIDTYDSSSSNSFNLASLTLLIELSDRSERLRSMIIDKKLPTFEAKLPRIIVSKGTPILKRLNRVQQRAVLRAIAAKEYFLIKGMPGTGKTATIVALIQLLVVLNKTVLITSHTHSAVDNVCTRLIKFGVKLMRLGNEAKMQETLKQYSEYNLTKNCKTPEELEEVYNSAQVLAVTCLGSGHPILSKRTLDICIVDESTQVLQCSVIRALYAAKTFILIGDPDQLPAVVRNREALEMGMSQSLFERLFHEESAIALNLNYRMNEPITELANALTYNGELLIGDEAVAKATLKIPNAEVVKNEYQTSKWLLGALDNSLKNSVQFVDTGPVWNLKHEVNWMRHDSNSESNESQTCVNIYEAAVVVHLVQALLKGGVSSEKIGVMATFRAQVAQISTLIGSTNVDISTVDQFQGKDKNVVVYSCVKSMDTSISQERNKFELLEDKRRLNVAITRAKNKLLIVGDLDTLNGYSTFAKIMPFLKRNVIKMDKSNVKWDLILDLKLT